MMGRREDRQGQFFYEFNLDEVVPPDHLVRRIDAVLDLGWVHKELTPYYSHTGRPSIDPVLMIWMLIIGHVFAIPSERRICAEVQVNLVYRWYCKLSVEGKIPDHSVFSRARHQRFRESDALRRVFERVVGLCIAAGKVEVRFAHMKRILKLDRLRLRGLSGAKDEVLLTATAQNLRRSPSSSVEPNRTPLSAWRRCRALVPSSNASGFRRGPVGACHYAGPMCYRSGWPSLNLDGGIVVARALG
jgi:transposase